MNFSGMLLSHVCPVQWPEAVLCWQLTAWLGESGLPWGPKALFSFQGRKGDVYHVKHTNNCMDGSVLPRRTDAVACSLGVKTTSRKAVRSQWDPGEVPEPTISSRWGGWVFSMGPCSLCMCCSGKLSSEEQCLWWQELWWQSDAMRDSSLGWPEPSSLLKGVRGNPEEKSGWEIMWGQDISDPQEGLGEEMVH